MRVFLLRLDDASEYIDVGKWERVEKLLDKFSIKPLVGIIPNNNDSELRSFGFDKDFWQRVSKWQRKKWDIAMHGYDHVFLSQNGGLNPINLKSEFAGIPLNVQKNKIRKGVELLRSRGIDPQYFFAPAHTFDKNTLKALKSESNVKFISDTIANDIYMKEGFVFIPQQSGIVRNLPFKVTTFCYHPNVMTDSEFQSLEMFLQRYQRYFASFRDLKITRRKRNLYDLLLQFLYFKILRRR